MKQNKTDLLAIAGDALETGAELTISLHDVTRGQAELIISEFAKRLGRTWQEQEREGTKWLEIVPHDKDQIDIVVYYK